MAGQGQEPNLLEGEIPIDGKFLKVRVKRLKIMDVDLQETSSITNANEDGNPRSTVPSDTTLQGTDDKMDVAPQETLPIINTESSTANMAVNSTNVNFFCHICQIEFKSKNGLSIHEGKIHPMKEGDKNLKCTDCEKIFPTRNKLVAHKLNHNKVNCGKCGKSLSSRNLKRHRLLFCKSNSSTLDKNVDANNRSTAVQSEITAQYSGEEMTLQLIEDPRTCSNCLGESDNRNRLNISEQPGTFRKSKSGRSKSGKSKDTKLTIKELFKHRPKQFIIKPQNNIV